MKTLEIDDFFYGIRRISPILLNQGANNNFLRSRGKLYQVLNIH